MNPIFHAPPNRAINLRHSEGVKKGQQEFEQAEGIADKTFAALSNPMMVGTTIVESIAFLAPHKAILFLSWDLGRLGLRFTPFLFPGLLRVHAKNGRPDPLRIFVAAANKITSVEFAAHIAVGVVSNADIVDDGLCAGKAQVFNVRVVCSSIRVPIARNRLYTTSRISQPILGYAASEAPISPLHIPESRSVHAGLDCMTPAL